MRTDDLETAAYTGGQMFRRYTRENLIRIMQSLFEISNTCGFFFEDIAHSI